MPEPPAESDAAADPQPPTETPSHDTEDKPRRGALIPILALVVLTAAVIAGARLLMGGDDGGTVETGTPVTAAAPAPGGYDFRLAHSSLCLAERREDGSGRVFQADCETSIPARGLQSVRAGIYRITTSHPDFGPGCMGIPGATMEPAGPVFDDFCDRGAAEEFRLERIGSGYLIRAVHSDLCLGVLNGSVEEWAPVLQLPCDSTAKGQVFELVPKT